jgi:hypothetical protein
MSPNTMSGNVDDMDGDVVFSTHDLPSEVPMPIDIDT